jgi:predicted DsbA family dithiol-disulfide isomerase
VEVEKLKKEYDVQVDWRPYFLRPDAPPEGWALPPAIKERVKDPNSPIKRRAAQAGLTMVHRDVIPSTRRAHQAAEYARAQGKLEPFHAALLRRYWSEGQDLWSWETLRATAQEVGLDPDELQRSVEEGRYAQVVEDSIREAQQLGVNGVPAFVLGDRFAISGAQDYSVFKQAMERLGAKPKAG